MINGYFQFKLVLDGTMKSGAEYTEQCGLNPNIS